MKPYFEKRTGSWYVKYRNGTGQHTETFGPGEAARRKAQAFCDDHARPAQRENDLRFSALAQAYIDVRGLEMEDSTREDWGRRMHRIILPVLEDPYVYEINRERLRAYQAARLRMQCGGPNKGRKVGHSTVYRETAQIQAILNWGADEGLITYNPVARFRGVTQKKEIILPPTEDEIAALLQHAAPHVARMIAISYYCGLRPGRRELFSMGWQNVDLKARTITVISAHKGGAPQRVIPIMDEGFLQMLIAWQVADGRKVGPIIHWGGKAIRHNCAAAFSEAKRRAGITRRLRPYDLRHKFASALVAQGVDVVTGSRLAGNTPQVFAQHYVHTDTPQLRQAMDRLPALPMEVNTGLARSTSRRGKRLRNIQANVPKEAPKLRVIAGG